MVINHARVMCMYKYTSKYVHMQLRKRKPTENKLVGSDISRIRANFLISHFAYRHDIPPAQMPGWDHPASSNTRLTPNWTTDLSSVWHPTSLVSKWRLAYSTLFLQVRIPSLQIYFQKVITNGTSLGCVVHLMLIDLHASISSPPFHLIQSLDEFTFAK